MDYGYKLTDKKLEELERKIAQVYKEAAENQRKIAEEYFEQFKVKDEMMKAALDGGIITDQYYKDWRLANIGRGKRFQAMRDELAERATRANEVAIAYVNDATPSIWTLNANYAAYTIENYAGNVGFTLYDENAIERLLVEEPDVMPYYPEQRAVNRGIDLEYGKKQITAQVTSSILTGQSIGHMADALMTRITTMERSSAIRAARTACTNAMNAGRQMQFEKAAAMGIRVKKRWRCVHDARTRAEHGDADGQIKEIKEPYEVGGEKLMFPADNAGSGWNIYNCRCRSENFLPDYPRDMGMTYNEWMESKNSGEKERQFGILYGKSSINADKKYINSKEYKDKFTGITGKEKVDLQIYNCSKRAILENSGKLTESFFLIDGDTGKVISEITDNRYKKEGYVSYPPYFKKALEKAHKQKKNIISVHNHPEGYPPSPNDMMSAFNHKYGKCIAVGTNGQVYEYLNNSIPLTSKDCDNIQELIKWNYDSGYDVDRAYLDIYNSFGLLYNIVGR